MDPPPPRVKISANTKASPDEEKDPPRKEWAPRQKVPLGGGYGLVAWNRISTNGQLEKAVRERNGPVRAVTREEVKQHRTAEHCWTILRGKVYDITEYLDYHPGGRDKLLMGAGKDCTSLFDKYHAWVNADHLLAKCLVGFLDTGAPPADKRVRKLRSDGS